jgi:hypothetical protein
LDALAIDSITAIFDFVHPDGRFVDKHLKTLRRLGAKRKAVLLAFPPKAAGTFLRSAIINAVDGQLVRTVHAQGGRDATPYLPTFVTYFSGGVTDKTLVTHVHMLALPANLHFLAAFGIRPIVMKRSIPDMLASYWDMLENDNAALLDGLNCHIPQNFRQLARDAKGDFLVDVLGPWYVNFYAGWLSHAEAHAGALCVLDFHALRTDPVETLKRCLECAGVKVARAKCEIAVQDAWNGRKKLRFNKGEQGRGRGYFRAPQLKRLARMLGHYPVLAPYRDELLGMDRS